MLNYIQFLLLAILLFLLSALIFLSTGIIYNKKGYVSVIEKKHHFYKLEDRRIAFAFPIIYRKVGYYPIRKTTYKIKDRYITILISDITPLYRDHIKLKKLLKDNKNLEANLKKYKIKIIK